MNAREYSRIPGELCYWITFLAKALPPGSIGTFKVEKFLSENEQAVCDILENNVSMGDLEDINKLDLNNRPAKAINKCLYLSVTCYP